LRTQFSARVRSCLQQAEALETGQLTSAHRNQRAGKPVLRGMGFPAHVRHAQEVRGPASASGRPTFRNRNRVCERTAYISIAECARKRTAYISIAECVRERTDYNETRRIGALPKLKPHGFRDGFYATAKSIRRLNRSTRSTTTSSRPLSSKRRLVLRPTSIVPALFRV
jgi:hypothetical protein